jgi:hypothetical protein
VYFAITEVIKKGHARIPEHTPYVLLQPLSLAAEEQPSYIWIFQQVITIIGNGGFT